MHVKIYGFCIMFFYMIGAERVHYVSVERPKVLYNDNRYVKNVVLTSRRVGRHNPIHYFNIDIDILEYAGNNVTISLYFYEFLTNTYKRSFFELHYKFCDFLERDALLGAVIKKRLKVTELCPLPPNHYQWKNITIPPATVPKNMPFQKGRLYTNVTFTKNKNPIVCTSVDFELKPLFTNLNKSDLFT